MIDSHTFCVRLSFFLPMDTLVVFKKQRGEITSAFSLVNDEILLNIPKKNILGMRKIEERMYSTAELCVMRDEIVAEHTKKGGGAK